MKQVTIESLKKGDVFQFSENGKLMVAEGYCRMNRKYMYSKYSGYICDNWSGKKKGTIVLID